MIRRARPRRREQVREARKTAFYRAEQRPYYSWGCEVREPQTPLDGLIDRRIPTAERFLLLPSIGVAAVAGWGLSRWRAAWIIPLCFLALTARRCLDWKSEGTMWTRTLQVADTPSALFYQIQKDRNAGRSRAVIQDAVRFERLFKEDIKVWPGPMMGRMLLWRAGAELRLKRFSDAAQSARAAARNDAGPRDHAVAADALHALGDDSKALAELDLAMRQGYGASQKFTVLADIGSARTSGRPRGPFAPWSLRDPGRATRGPGVVSPRRRP